MSKQSMLVGHIGAAMLAKQVEPRLSLGTALLASLLADLLLFTLVLGGVEQVQFRSGAAAAAPFVPLRVTLSHSLVMTAVWGAALTALCVAGRKRAAGAWIVVAVAASHWVLDLIGHTLPVAPGAAIHVGSVLSTRIPIVMVVEAAIWIGALIMYVRDSRSLNSAGRYVFWGGITSWTYVWWANQAGPVRRADDAPTEMIIVLLMIVGWGYWMNRARQPTSDRPMARPGFTQHPAGGSVRLQEDQRRSV